ncbi:unnamed protein product (mitochondrion) [Musa banksii]
MPLGISGTFYFMIVLLAEHNILMHLFHMLGVALVYSALVLCMVPWSTLSIVAAHGYLSRLICQYASFNNSTS